MTDRKRCVLCDQKECYAPDSEFEYDFTCKICKRYFCSNEMISKIEDWEPNWSTCVKENSRLKITTISMSTKINMLGGFFDIRHRLSGYFFEVGLKEKGKNFSKRKKESAFLVDNWKEILKSPLVSIPEESDFEGKIKKLLGYIKHQVKVVGKVVEVNKNIVKAASYAQNTGEACLYLEECIRNDFIDVRESSYAMPNLNSDHLSHLKNIDLERIKGMSNEHWLYLSLKIAGAQYLSKTDNISKKIFIATAFKKDVLAIFTEDDFRKKIKKETNGYELFLVSDPQHNGFIDNEIIALINQSKAVIADFTYGNQGVYYEAGYAHGQKKEVIYTCRKKEFEETQEKSGVEQNGKKSKTAEKIIHFDIRQRNFIVWEDKEDLKKKLIDRINATIYIDK